MNYAYTVTCAYNANSVLNEMSQTYVQPPCSVSLVAERITALSPPYHRFCYVYSHFQIRSWVL